jgi:predicted GTPase
MRKRTKVVIMGAAGRDFHNFNVVFRDNPAYEVVAFTATQIPNIDGRRYPSQLAGKLYPGGIKIYSESDLESLVKRLKVDVVAFSYSDVSYEYVMHRSALCQAAGASFLLLGPKQTMLRSRKPVVSICAVRTGSGKSQTTRKVCEILTKAGKRVVVVRHPMPYGDLVRQRVQRFARLSDLDKEKCTIEEREEYEPHIVRGNVVYAGVDYGAILLKAQREADVLVWDGGNNDLPFYRPDLHIVLVDPHRPGHELSYYPGEANLRMADVVIVNKTATASKDGLETVLENIRAVNQKAKVIKANSPVKVDDPSVIAGKRVLVVEDGPTLTHGGMKYGAGVVAAKEHRAKEIVDPRKWAVGTITETYDRYPGTGRLLPAMGYSPRQVADLEKTINACPADSVVIATPIDLRRLIDIKKPSVRVSYELKELSPGGLKRALSPILKA